MMTKEGGRVRVTIELCVLAATFFVLGVSGFVDQMAMPSEGWELDFDHRVTSVRAGSAAESSGLRPGDEILTINGIELGDSAQIRRLSARLLPGDTLRVEYDRQGERRRAALRLGPPDRYTLLGAVVQLIIGSVFALCALAVRRRMAPGAENAQLFIALSYLYALLKVTHLRPVSPPMIALYRFSFQMVGFALPLVFVHFALVFRLRRRRLTRPRFVALFYSPLWALLVLAAAAEARFLVVGASSPTLDAVVLSLGLLLWFVCLLFGSILLLIKLLRPMSPEHLRLLRPLLLAMIASVAPYLIVFASHLVIGSPPRLAMLAELPSVALPLIMARIIVRSPPTADVVRGEDELFIQGVGW